MAIYKSSFNKKPEKKEKPVKEKPEKVKEPKFKKKVKVNAALICLISFLAVFVICLPPNFFKSVMLGLFGLLVYPVCLIGALFSGLFLAKKKIKAQTKYIVYLATALGIIWFIFHLILTSKLPTTNYGIFLKETYLAKTTAGGILFSLISYPVTKLLTISSLLKSLMLTT